MAFLTEMVTAVTCIQRGRHASGAQPLRGCSIASSLDASARFQFLQAPIQLAQQDRELVALLL
jgi:hypothetical protein